MTGPAASATDRAPEPGQPGRAAKGIGRAAILIAALTILARVLGLARTVVFAGTVKTACLGAAYVTANQVPNVIYDIVLGGALTSIMVPILARPAERSGAAAGPVTAGPVTAGPVAGGPVAGGPVAGGPVAGGPVAAGPAAAGPSADPAAANPAAAGPAADPAAAGPGALAEVSRISAALLTWTIAILLPASAAVAVIAGPVISWLDPPNLSSSCVRPDVVHVASRMLAVFAPQILLYGLAVVLYGILQAHRRFTAPALAPVLSSLVLIAAYLIFVPLGGQHTSRLAGLSPAALLTLAVGTTVGVAALVLTALVPAWRLRLRLRPTFRFPDGVARRARGLAAVGVATLVAQDASVLVVTALANGHGGQAAVAVYSYGWQVFASAYAVLAIPVAISAFPVLSARQGDDFNATAASSTRATMLTSWLGAGLLAGAAFPVSRAFPDLSQPQAHQLAVALALFAPGLAGYGLVACLSRVLLADGRNRVAAAAVSAGWLLVIAMDVAVVPHLPHASVVPVLGLANTVGMTASGAALLLAVRRARGQAALLGTARAAAAGLAAALAGAAAGAAISAFVPVTGNFLNGCVALLACACALAVFGAVAYGLDGGDLRAVLARVRRRAAP